MYAEHEPESAAGRCITEVHRAYVALCGSYSKGDRVVLGGREAGLAGGGESCHFERRPVFIPY